MRLKDLTNGEQLFVFRRRRGVTQAQAAKILDVSTNQYRDWETDVDHASRSTVRDLKTDGSSLVECEIATTMRRRKGIKQPVLADELGISTNWLCRMEKGDVNMNDDLLNYWNLA